MASAAFGAAYRLGRGASDADISLRELYRRRVEAQQLLSVSQGQLGKLEPVARSQGSVAQAPLSKARAPLGKEGQPSPSKLQLHKQATKPTGSPPGSPSIAAFRPHGSPAIADSQHPNCGSSKVDTVERSPFQSVTLHQGFVLGQQQTYQPAHPPSATANTRRSSLPSSLHRSQVIDSFARRPTPVMSPPATQRASPEAPCSEISTVQRAVNAAIASSVELLLSSPPPCLLPQLESPVAFAPSPSENGTAASPNSHLGKVDGQRLAGSRFDNPRPVPSSNGDKQPLSLEPVGGDIGWRSLDLPVPPAVPSPPPQPCTTESFAMEMRAALSPTFMTSRNRPIFCELDDPGSGIRFPSSRHSSRIQRLLGRLKSCFVPPAHDCGRASELDTALSSSGGLRQVSSPQMPQLAIPSAMAPLRRSMAGLPGEEAPATGCWYAKTSPARPSTAAAVALPPRPPLQPGHKHPSPPHADLLGLLEEPSEVIINIASPPPHAIQRQQPNGVYDRLGSGAGSVCATPSEQMIALGLLSSRCGTPEGVVEDPSPSQMPAKRCLMGLLKSGPQIFGTQQQQQAEGPQGELLGEPLGQPPEAQQTQQQQQSDQQTEPTLSCHAGGLQQLGQGQAQELQQAQLLQQQGHVLSQRRDASSAGTSGAACPERPSAAELREQEQHSSSLQAYEQQQAKQGTPALQIERGVSSAPAGAAEFSQQQQEQQRENSYEPLKPAATCHNRPSPHKQTGVAVRRTAVTLSQLLKAKAPTPPSSGKKRRRQPSPVPHEAAVRQSQNSKLLQAQRSLDAAKEAASRQQRLAAKPQPAAVRRPFQPVNQQGCRDLSKPSYRSKALHAILSPVKAHQPRQLARQASVTVSAGPGRVAGVVSAPTSPGLGAAGYAAAKRLTVSEPGSSVQAGHITSVPTSPAVPARKPPMRWNQTAAAQAAALRSKSQRQEGQPVAGRQVTLKSQALGRKDGPDDADQLAAVAAALHAEAHELASPEKTARPHYQQQRSSTPAEQQVSVFSGEAGVEPYSVQPRDRGKEQRRPASSSVPAAHLQALSVASEDDGSPVSMNKYQADRDQYLQVLQQLALGMDVSASTVLPHKLPTPPPLPAEVLGETALQPVQRPTQQQRALPGRQRPTDSVETVEAKAVEGRPSAVVPSLRRRAVAPQLAAARYMIQRNALVDEDDRESTSRTLVYSLSAAHSHSNDLFEQDVQSIDAVGTGVTQEAPAVTVQAHHSQQKLVSIHAAIHRALSSREGSTMKEGSKPEGSAGTDRAGYGAVARKAAGQQTVSKPARKHRR